MPLTREQQVIVDQCKALLELVPVIGALERELYNNPTNLAFQANTTVVTRKCADILKSVRTQLNNLEEKVAVQATQILPNLKPPRYSTEYCTVSDNTSFYVAYPTDPDKPRYYDFVKALGDDYVNLMRPHYPAIGERFVELFGQSKQIPWGLKANDVKGVDCKLRVTTAGKKEL